MDRPRILIVEDESALVETYKRALLEAGYDVWSTPTGEEALTLFARVDPHLVLLDIGLPGHLDGFDVLEELRERRFAQVLVITARGTDPDRMRAFDLGADDYVVKPVSNAVLVRRVRAALRHVREPRAPAFGLVFEFSDVIVDLNRAALIRIADGTRLQISPIERRLLARLLAEPGLAVPEGELLRAGWGAAASMTAAAPEDAVETNVLRLRKKLARIGPGAAELIFNVRGEGYGIERPRRIHAAQDYAPPTQRGAKAGRLAQPDGPPMPPDPVPHSSALASSEPGAASRCDELIGNFTHEARGELADAIALADRLADPNLTQQDHEEVRHTFRHLLARLVPLFDGLSDIHDLDQGLSPAVVKAIDLVELVATAAEMLQEDHPARYFEVSFEPPSPAVLAVEHRATQIVERLLYNAANYTSGDVFVHLTAHAATARVCVTVSDQGPAWPAEARELIFARLDKLPEAPGHWPRYALPLGLYVARERARRMGGEVEWESNADGGNDFRLCLPASPPAS